MPSAFTIAGELGWLTINVLGYENNCALNVDDANWLQCFIELSAGGVEARYPASLTTHELVDLECQLIKLMSEPGGVMSYVADEDCFGLKIKFDNLGGIKIEGDCKVVGPPKVTLSFLFHSDQTLISKLIGDIQIVLQRFPVKVAI